MPIYTLQWSYMSRRLRFFLGDNTFCMDGNQDKDAGRDPTGLLLAERDKHLKMQRKWSFHTPVLDHVC